MKSTEGGSRDELRRQCIYIMKTTSSGENVYKTKITTELRITEGIFINFWLLGISIMYTYWMKEAFNYSIPHNIVPQSPPSEANPDALGTKQGGGWGSPSQPERSAYVIPQRRERKS